jgi:hypothetical protein
MLFSFFSSTLNSDPSRINLSSPGSGLNSNWSFFASFIYDPSFRRISPFGTTTIADSPWTGHLCSQNPQPLHFEAITTGRRYPSTGWKTMAWYGQISAQIKQILFWAQTRHISFRKTDVPTLAWVFSSKDSDRIACVGQTLPQTLQFWSHGAKRVSIFGVHRPENPDSQRQGCKVFVKQDFMHSPQRMQVRKNSVSGMAPGGRMSGCLPCLKAKGVRMARKPTPNPPAKE